MVDSEPTEAALLKTTLVELVASLLLTEAAELATEEAGALLCNADPVDSDGPTVLVTLPLLAVTLELGTVEGAVDADKVTLPVTGPTELAAELEAETVVSALLVGRLELSVTGAEWVWVSTTVLATVVPFSTDDTVDVQRVV